MPFSASFDTIEDVEEKEEKEEHPVDDDDDEKEEEEDGEEEHPFDDFDFDDDTTDSFIGLVNDLVRPLDIISLPSSNLYAS